MGSLQQSLLLAGLLSTWDQKSFGKMKENSGLEILLDIRQGLDLAQSPNIRNYSLVGPPISFTLTLVEDLGRCGESVGRYA